MAGNQNVLRLTGLQMTILVGQEMAGNQNFAMDVLISMTILVGQEMAGNQNRSAPFPQPRSF